MKTKTLVIGALIAALSYIAFAFFKIDITVMGSKTAFHLGNAFVVIGALLLGGVTGGISGAVGLTLADLTSGYAIYAPTTFILKLCIGIITGFVAHRIGKVNTISDVKQRAKWVFISTLAGMIFNIIFDPLFSFIRSYILLGLGVNEVAGKQIKAVEVASILAKWSALTTFVNAILTIIFVCITYTYLSNRLFNSSFTYRYKKGDKHE